MRPFRLQYVEPKHYGLINRFISDADKTLYLTSIKAKFRVRTSHVCEPNRMQMRKILCSP